jgi:hypothetical protein
MPRIATTAGVGLAGGLARSDMKVGMEILRKHTIRSMPICVDGYAAAIRLHSQIEKSYTGINNLHRHLCRPLAG